MIIILIILAIVSLALGILLGKNMTSKNINDKLVQAHINFAKLEASFNEKEKIFNEIKINNEILSEEINISKIKIDNLSYENGVLNNENNRLKEIYNNLEKQFNNLADNILKNNSQTFLNSTKELMDSYQQRSEMNFNYKHEQIDKLLAPIDLKIKEIDNQLIKFNENTKTEFKSSIDNLLLATRETMQKAHELTLTLTHNNKRTGNWGELHLENLLSKELQLKGAIDYIRQQGRADGKPDFVLNLPEGKRIIIDCKTPMKYYYEGVNSDDDEIAKEKFKQLSVSIKAQINSLANKNYNKDYDSFDCIVIYLPIDMMLIYAIDEDKNLLTYAFEKRIILATPMTIFPLLTTLKYMWDNYNTVKNITEIIDIVKNIYKSIGEVGGSLVKAQEFLTQATMVYNANIVPKTSELKNLGVAVEYKPYKTAKIKTDIISELPIVEAISSTIEKEFSNIES